MKKAIEAGQSVLLNEQAALLRECRKVLNDIVTKYPYEKDADRLLNWLNQPKPKAIFND